MGAMLRRETYRARQLRRTQTRAEAALWKMLRARRLAGLKFRRQQPLGPFIADFFCAEAALVVEADGAVHLGRHERDAARDAWLEAAGVAVVRFSNDEILGHPRRVSLALLRAASSRLNRG
jgi:very-short-patch-repair endonuclease